MAEKKTIFVVSGYHHHFAEGDHDIITDVFNTREDAVKFIFDILKDTFPNDADKFSIDCCRQLCMYGNNYYNGNEEVNLKVEEFSI